MDCQKAFLCHISKFCALVRRNLLWRQGIIWEEEKWTNWSNYNYNNLYKIPKSSNVLPIGNSINVTRVARVLVEERYFVYCASYETAFTFLNWNISYTSGHLRLETGCSFIKMYEGTISWIVIVGARRRQRRMEQLTIPDQGISILNFPITLNTYACYLEIKSWKMHLLL